MRNVDYPGQRMPLKRERFFQRTNVDDMPQKRGERFNMYRKKSPYGDPEYEAWANAAAMGKRSSN